MFLPEIKATWSQLEFTKVKSLSLSTIDAPEFYHNLHITNT